MKADFNFLKRIILFLAVFCLFTFSLSAKKKKSALTSKATGNYEAEAESLQEESQPTPAAEEETAESEETEVKVKLPSARRTYFSKIDPAIVAGVEKGSPSSLKEAMAKIRKNESEYTDVEKVLIEIASEILKTAWPSEKQTWDSFSVNNDNSYIGAIESERNGIFDSSTGNQDFLSTILPAFIIFRPSYNLSQNQNCYNAISASLQLNPSSVLANYMMGLLCEKEQNNAEAKVFFQTAYELDQPALELSLSYARILQKTGDLTTASSIMSTLPSDSLNLDLLKQKAYVAFASKEYELAEEYVGKVLQQTPNDLDFVLFRAKILTEKKDYIHAVSLLDMYARQNNTAIDYLILRARVQMDWSKNTSAATDTIEKALQLYPDNLEALMFAARISSVTDSPVAGKYADELSSKVLQAEPDNEAALYYALNGLAKRENWQEAYLISSKLVQKASPASEIIEKHVQICIKLGKKNEAFECAKKALDINPNDETLLQAYILAYSETASRDLVVKYINSLLDSSSAKMKSYLYYRRSYLQYSEDNALSDLRSSLISNPRNSDALFRLYEIYYAKKDYRKAQYYLRQVVAINPNDTSVKKLNEALTKLIQ